MTSPLHRVQRSVQALLEIRKSPGWFQSRQACLVQRQLPAKVTGAGMEAFFESTKNKSSRERMTRRGHRRCSSFSAVTSRVRRQWRAGGGSEASWHPETGSGVRVERVRRSGRGQPRTRDPLLTRGPRFYFNPFKCHICF